MSNPKLYPLKFTPILKEKIWGGASLKNLFNKAVGEGVKIGESWELSGVKDNISVVSEGSLKGKSINDLIAIYGSALLGRRVLRHYGAQFPLLFKFIDAAEDLSVQLHPDDALAKERHDSYGKTEMWYILEAAANARLLLGFNEDIGLREYEQCISENKLLDIIKIEHIAVGDAFFIAPGTIHAIGAGTVLAEIQQTSDVTYRVYDWDRPGLDGKMRDLHTEEAKEAIKFDNQKARLIYDDTLDDITLISESAYFKTSKIKCKEVLHIDYTNADSFKVYMNIGAQAIIKTDEFEVSLNKGETLLIPACINQVSITSQNGEILEVYIP